MARNHERDNERVHSGVQSFVDPAYFRRLPQGTWLLLTGRYYDVKDVEIQEMLYNQGIDVPLECISANDNGTWIICLTPDVVAALINWICQEAPSFHGKTVRFTAMRKG